MVKLTQEMIDAQIEKADANAQEIDLKEPRAVKVFFDENDSRVLLRLNNGSDFAFFTSQVEELANLPAEILAEVTLTSCGKGLRWETPDIDLSVQGLLLGIFGSKSWMSEQNRKRLQPN